MERYTYDNVPDLRFFGVHSIVIVGLGFGLFATQADVKHRMVNVCGFLEMGFEGM
jgi:hypothetical protein